MPWTVSDVPRFTKKAKTAAQKKKWVSIANGVLKSCQASGGKDCEGKAIRIANSKFDLVDINSIWTFDDIDEHDKYFEMSEEEIGARDEEFGFKKGDTKKPGGSNAGKYKSGPFCGPSGGAPKGTYPVNTRKRAIAAIAYARHAPNPGGIKSCVCRHWPGLAACKKKSKQSEGTTMSEQKLPKGALRFVDEGCHANVELVESDGKRMPKLNMVAYSGGIIKGHWYWDNLAIDLDGIEFKQSRYPVLEDHRTDRKVAVIGKPVIKEGKLMAPENAKFLDTEASNEFQKLSGDGFPYQSSIYAKPSNVERIEEGASAKVNGLTMKGPGSIWRKCEFKEMSVCVFGWDSKTKASAFSKEEMEDVEFLEEVTKVKIDDNIKQGKEVKKKMDREELMETYPDLIKGIVEEALSESQTKFDVEKKTLQDQLAAAKQSNAEMSDRVLKLEKKDMLRHEKEQKDLADTIWARKLAASDVPSRIHEKVKQHVGYSKFMKDDVLDVTAFSEAVDAEIKSWESLGTTNAVMGTSQTQKEVDTNAKAEEIKLTENKSIVDRLVQLSGVKVPKKE